MKKIKVIKPLAKTAVRKKVAAYCRVSMESERLMHSLSAQISYYSEFIQNNPDWEYAGVYADRFISGTSTKKRAEFQRLIEDCDNGKVDIILCKSISRFARNTVDLLETIRHLKDIGVEVRFEKENINSLSESGELMLTLLASFAQEESISISENCKWGIRRTYQNGTDGVRNKIVFGYRYDGVKYVIVPEEAKVVKYIFKRYLDGLGYRSIADEIKGSGIEYVAVKYILSNEIYAGDRVLQKVFVTDPISKRKIKNRGELPKYLIQDCHEAIIDRETFDKVQAEIKRRAAIPTITAFTHKIKCMVCGRYYTRRAYKNYIKWFCRKKKTDKCNSTHFDEEQLKNISSWVLEIDEFNPDIFEEKIKIIKADMQGNLTFVFYDGSVKEWVNLVPVRNEYSNYAECFKDKIKCSSCGEFYHRKKLCNKNIYWYCIGKRRQVSKHKKHSCSYNESYIANISAYILGLENFEEDVFNKTIEFITVAESGDLHFTFKDGREKIWRKL